MEPEWGGSFFSPELWACSEDSCGSDLERECFRSGGKSARLELRSGSGVTETMAGRVRGEALTPPSSTDMSSLPVTEGAAACEGAERSSKAGESPRVPLCIEAAVTSAKVDPPSLTRVQAVVMDRRGSIVRTR